MLSMSPLVVHVILQSHFGIRQTIWELTDDAPPSRNENNLKPEERQECKQKFYIYKGFPVPELPSQRLRKLNNSCNGLFPI